MKKNIYIYTCIYIYIYIYLEQQCLHLWENDECLGSLINDSAFICDEIIETTKNTINFGNKKATCTIDNC